MSGAPKQTSLTGPALELVNQYIQPSQASNRVPRVPKPGKLRVNAVAPIEQLLGILASPASHSGFDGRELVQVQPPAEACSVCWNLNPSLASQNLSNSREESSWAETEYKLSTQVPASKVKIENSNDLLARADQGCFYCRLVQLALTTADPTWQNEKTYIDIFLASNLPVVIRLYYGAMTKVAMGREEALGLNYDIPEGQILNFTIEMLHPTKKPIDIEIYRPKIPEKELTVGGTTFPILQNKR